MARMGTDGIEPSSVHCPSVLRPLFEGDEILHPHWRVGVPTNRKSMLNAVGEDTDPPSECPRFRQIRAIKIKIKSKKRPEPSGLAHPRSPLFPSLSPFGRG